MDNSDNSQHLCPLCSGDNHCVMAADPGASACWCQEVVVSAAALAAIPEAARNRRCLCRACATATPEPENAG